MLINHTSCITSRIALYRSPHGLRSRGISHVRYRRPKCPPMWKPPNDGGGPIFTVRGSMTGAENRNTVGSMRVCGGTLPTHCVVG
jgi:hypothetical protein